MPPAEVWRLVSVSYDKEPTPADVAQETARVVGDLTWRAALPHMPRRDMERLARRLAEERLEAARRPGVQERHELLNAGEVAAGRALAAAHGPLLAALGTVLEKLDDTVPRSALAAKSDPDLCLIAAQRVTAAYQAFVMRAGVVTALCRECQNCQGGKYRDCARCNLTTLPSGSAYGTAQKSVHAAIISRCLSSMSPRA